MGLLTKDQIWAADDLAYEDVPVPEWGGTVRVRTLIGSERDQYESESVKVSRSGKREMNLANVRARLVALCVIDETGALVFTRADVMKLGQKSARALDRVFEVASRLNGMTEEDMEDLAGNSEGGQKESSTSD